MVIAAHFGDALDRSPERPFLLNATREHRYADFFQYCGRLAGGLSRLQGHHIACYMADSAELVAVILAAGMSGKSLLLLNRDFTGQQLPALLQRYPVDTLISDAIDQRG